MWTIISSLSYVIELVYEFSHMLLADKPYVDIATYMLI